MTDPVRLKLENPGEIKEIPFGCVCSNAKFVFDQPVAMLDQNYIEMVDGQFWLIEGNTHFFLEGKWTDSRNK